MSFSMTDTELKEIDSAVEQMMNSFKKNQILAEQLALDFVRLISYTEDNYDKLQKQGFFERCLDRILSVNKSFEKDTSGSLVEMQKIGSRFLKIILQQEKLLPPHSMVSIKNNLNELQVPNEDKQKLISELAMDANKRFLDLERQLDECETNVNLQGWLLTLEERELDVLYPTPLIRMLEVINQFYQNKSDDWNNKDLLFMKKALRTVGIDPKQKYSIKEFFSTLLKELFENGHFELFKEELGRVVGADKTKFIFDSVSSPLFVIMHSVMEQYEEKQESIEELKEELNLTTAEALLRIITRKLKQLNVNVDYSYPLAELAIEILGSVRLVKLLDLKNENESNAEVVTNDICAKDERVVSNDQKDEESEDCDSETLDKLSLLSSILEDVVSNIYDWYWQVFSKVNEFHSEYMDYMSSKLKSAFGEKGFFEAVFGDSDEEKEDKLKKLAESTMDEIRHAYYDNCQTIQEIRDIFQSEKDLILRATGENITIPEFKFDDDSLFLSSVFMNLDEISDEFEQKTTALSEYYDNMQEEMRVIYNKVEKVVNGRRVI
jgi:hypothetical protein